MKRPTSASLQGTNMSRAERKQDYRRSWALPSGSMNSHIKASESRSRAQTQGEGSALESMSDPSARRATGTVCPTASTVSAEKKVPARVVKADAAYWVTVTKEPRELILALGRASSGLPIPFLQIVQRRYQPFTDHSSGEDKLMSDSQSERLQIFQKTIQKLEKEISYAHQTQSESSKDCVVRNMGARRFSRLRREIKRSLTRILLLEVPEVESGITNPWFMNDQYLRHFSAVEDGIQDVQAKQEELWGKRKEGS
jgi:hypothetical protein